jgi:hypothetical protein
MMPKYRLKGTLREAQLSLLAEKKNDLVEKEVCPDSAQLVTKPRGVLLWAQPYWDGAWDNAGGHAFLPNFNQPIGDVIESLSWFTLIICIGTGRP